MMSSPLKRKIEDTTGSLDSTKRDNVMSLPLKKRKIVDTRDSLNSAKLMESEWLVKTLQELMNNHILDRGKELRAKHVSEEECKKLLDPLHKETNNYILSKFNKLPKNISANDFNNELAKLLAEAIYKYIFYKGSVDREHNKLTSLQKNIAAKDAGDLKAVLDARELRISVLEDQLEEQSARNSKLDISVTNLEARAEKLVETNREIDELRKALKISEEEREKLIQVNGRLTHRIVELSSAPVISANENHLKNMLDRCLFQEVDYLSSIKKMRKSELQQESLDNKRMLSKVLCLLEKYAKLSGIDLSVVDNKKINSGAEPNTSLDSGIEINLDTGGNRSNYNNYFS